MKNKAASPPTTDSAERTQCSPDGWCSTLASRLVEPNRTGISIAWLINFKTGARRRIVTHRLSPREQGMALNFCPWCGESLEWTYATQTKPFEESAVEPSADSAVEPSALP